MTLPTLPQLDGQPAERPRNSVELRQARHAVYVRMGSTLRTAQAQRRNLTADEETSYTADEQTFERLTGEILTAEAREAEDARNARPIGGGTQAGEMAARYRMPATRQTSRDAVLLRSTDTVAGYVRDRGYAGEPLHFGRLVRGMAGMGWHGADAERRSLVEGNATAGGILVPEPIAADVLDLARARTQVVAAGARTVPMESRTLKIGRQTGDPELTWHEETAPIAESALTFDAVTLTARTLPCLVKASIEWLEDVDDAEDIVRTAIAERFAREIDRVALRGTGVAPQPRGLRNTAGVTITDLGPNGVAPSWDHLVRAAGVVSAANWTPTAAIHHPRTQTDLMLTKASDGQYIAPPAGLLAVRQLTSTNVPANLTKGTAAGVASEAYVGAWDQLLLGMRTSFTIQPLLERYADTGEVGFFAYLRMDVAVAHPEAFVVLDGFVPAAA